MRVTRQRALMLAREHAKAKLESYYAEPFQPHEWVLDAIEAALLEHANDFENLTKDEVDYDTWLALVAESIEISSGVNHLEEMTTRPEDFKPHYDNGLTGEETARLVFFDKQPERDLNYC